MVSSFLSWYIFVQLISFVTVPLAFQLFRNLPDRGYALSKSLGILLVGFTLWFGTSYGLLRNETGGAWLSILIVATVSLLWGQSIIRQILARRRLPLTWRYIAVVEILFLVAFAGWAMVRAYDPAVNHTEQPMDLMFMNGIWNSPTYPPHDPWLSGYAISYYYFGYWLLIMLGRLAGQPPEIAYNLGQACWYSLLLLGAFGMGYNLLAQPNATTEGDEAGTRFAIRPIFGGLLASITVGVIGNLQGFFEWLYATGVNITGLASWFSLRNFPPTDGSGNVIEPTGDWYIDFGWWWWRSSRVIADSDLMGNHIEVIDEFPMFSYILGDNHPHVLAMPFILLVIGLALNLFFTLRQPAMLGENGETVSFATRIGIPTIVVMIIAVGSLIPFNTWDFPGAWVLVILSIFAPLWWQSRQMPAEARPTWLRLFIHAIGFGFALLIGTIILYFPYFLTAQSQARGLVPNLFNPTQFSQFFVMFGPFLFGVMALIGVASLRVGLSITRFLISLLIVYGAPILFLVLSITVASETAFGQQALSRMTLPEGAEGHTEFVIERWQNAPWTFIVLGLLLSLVVALIWQTFATQAAPKSQGSAISSPHATLFVLFLTGLGLLLVYAPEFVYILDNFNSRMNTVFKFYYQAWLLLGLSSAYVVFIGLSQWRARQAIPALLSVVTLAFIGAGLFFPVAAIYSKAGGFANPTPTFDSTAYIQTYNPSEMAAITWVRQNTAPDALIVEGKGASYRADYNRISTITGRPTLLGWDGHESQWRGEAYGEMVQGRPEALEAIYRSNAPEQIEAALTQWAIDYVYLGPTERSQYGVTPRTEESLSVVMDLVFEDGNVQIYQRQGFVTTQK